MSGDFSKALFAFVIKNIDSVELLEVLVLLHSNQEKAWGPRELDQQIRSSELSILKRLEHLASLGIAAKASVEPVTYRYHPQNEDLGTFCENLVLLYQT